MRARKKDNKTKAGTQPERLTKNDIPLCSRGKDCPRSASCIHSIRYEQSEPIEGFANCYDPRIDPEACRQYTKNETIEVAFGMKAICREVKSSEARIFRGDIMGAMHWHSSNQFYRLRRGEVPIYGEMRHKIEQICRAYNVPTTFDRYERRYPF